MVAAAFFDLDRTLLRGASGPVISEALRAKGVLSERGIPGEGLVYRVFDFVGETRASMMLTRQAARFAKGWSRDRVRAAGEMAAEQLAGAVQPFARPVIDDHRTAGRPLVLATTTPDDMIRPLADRLGFDDLVATRYGVDGDGRYDGTIDGEFVWGKGKLRAVRALVRPGLLPWVRFDIEGVERIPASGPAILVANHRSYFDPMALGTTLARRGRAVRFLGKREVFDAPIVGSLVRAMGGIRVERSTGSDQPLVEAAAALASGELVAILPEGTIPRGPAFFEPQLEGRWGAARLAAQAKVPVVPIGMWGTEKVWPRSERFPRVLNLTHPPTVTVRVGDPVTLNSRSPQADTKRIMAAIVELLPPEARQRREPTPEELAHTYPPGHRPDGDG